MKNEIVYDHLCKAIFNGELKPGERIIIRKIGQQLKVSDIPVREAIKMLVAVGLVDSTPHAGAVVKDISIEDRKEMLMILAEDDSIVSTASCLEMADTLRAGGAEIETVVLPHADHGFDQSERSPISTLRFDAGLRAEAQWRIESFLRRVAVQ